jgi:two-component system osmolarity sensor histidine kinase EnvZ
MKLLPRTLLARLMLLIALLLAAGQYAAFRLFEYFEIEPRAAAASLQAVSVVNLTQAALFAAQEDRRLPLLKELSQKEGVRVYPIDLLEEVEPWPDDPLSRRIASRIRAALGEDTLVAYNHLGVAGLWVSFSIDDDDFWVVIPNIRIEQAFPWKWLGWGALVLALSLLGAYLIASRINRPLRLLAAAADQVARGQAVQKLPPDGVEELQRVNRTFNEMTEALARLDAERTLLLAGVSHDLRTPLARLRLAVEMLPQADGFKAGMAQDIEDMDGIIQQFLDFVRGIEGETAQPCDLNVLIQGIAERYRRGGKTIALSLEPLPLIPLREQAMQRLLGNLVDNAFAYGHGHVEIVTHGQKDSIAVSVLDRGPGIPEAEIPRLLRPFERMDPSRGSLGGSGLGLAIADRIARMHGGFLVLSNRPEGGLEARVTLPV